VSFSGGLEDSLKEKMEYASINAVMLAILSGLILATILLFLRMFVTTMKGEPKPE